MLIRQETNHDHDVVYSVIKAAFATAEHRDGNEQDLVVALRKSNSFVPELSLVAETDGNIVGHIMFTKAEIGSRTELVLAPLSVLPNYQKRGIGTALIGQGHRIAEQLGYQYCVVLGSAAYYPRFGYIPAVNLGIQAPFEIPSENFMAIKLKQATEVIAGVVQYPPEFGV